MRAKKGPDMTVFQVNGMRNRMAYCKIIHWAVLADRLNKRIDILSISSSVIFALSPSVWMGQFVYCMICMLIFLNVLVKFIRIDSSRHYPCHIPDSSNNWWLCPSPCFWPCNIHPHRLGQCFPPYRKWSSPSYTHIPIQGRYCRQGLSEKQEIGKLTTPSSLVSKIRYVSASCLFFSFQRHNSNLRICPKAYGSGTSKADIDVKCLISGS